jgi:hypothetical protein
MKKIYFLLFLLPFFTYAQSPVTKSAGFGEELPSAACLSCPGTDWNNPMNITVADNAFATTGLNANPNCFQSSCYYSRYLYAHNFNFSIPIGATIDTIIVDILRRSSNTNSLKDSIVQLEKSATIVGSNLASGNFWPTSAATQSYGLTDPLWSTSWLPSDINDPGTGMVLKVENLSSVQQTAGVDHIQMTVYYSTTTGNFSVTSSPSNVEWINSKEEIAATIFTPVPINCSSKIYTSCGQEVASIEYGQSSTGINHFVCPAENLEDGIYFWEIRIGENLYCRKFAITK